MRPTTRASTHETRDLRLTSACCARHLSACSFPASPLPMSTRSMGSCFENRLVPPPSFGLGCPSGWCKCVTVTWFCRQGGRWVDGGWCGVVCVCAVCVVCVVVCVVGGQVVDVDVWGGRCGRLGRRALSGVTFVHVPARSRCNCRRDAAEIPSRLFWTKSALVYVVIENLHLNRHRHRLLWCRRAWRA